MRTKRANIDDFLHRTKANILSGYRKNVDFIESTAEEMVFLTMLAVPCKEKSLLLTTYSKTTCKTPSTGSINVVSIITYFT